MKVFLSTQNAFKAEAEWEALVILAQEAASRVCRALWHTWRGPPASLGAGWGDGRVGWDGHDEQIKSQINKTELEDVCPCFRNMNG